jgi:carboxymethylenebutenolidase
MKLNRPEGPLAGDLNLSRRMLGGAFFAGYAAFALGAEAEPIHTDEAGLVTATVQLPAADRPVPAYLARPDRKGRSPVVLVVSEVFGIHEYIRDVCRRLAKAGYVALAPDFFVRHGDPAPLTDFGEIRKIVDATSEAEVMGDIGAAIAWLGGQPFADKKHMAVTGFCWGGAVVWLACERFKDFRCGVAWYGKLTRPKPGEFMSQPERHWPLEQVPQLKAPVLGLYGGQDQGIPMSDIGVMTEALAHAPVKGSDIIVYGRSQHGFHADYRPSYDPSAAKDGWRRMLEFFAAHGVRGSTRA